MYRYAVVILVVTALAAVHADPGAEHEAAMKQAQRAAGRAKREIEKRIATVKTDVAAFNALQAEYQQTEATVKMLTGKLATALKASPEYKGLIAERKRIDKERNAAGKAGNKKKQAKLNKAKYQIHVKTEKLKQKLLPTEFNKLRTAGRKFRHLKGGLTQLALQELGEHPELKSHIAVWRRSQKAEAEHRAAMYRARGQVTPVEYLAQQRPPRFKNGHTLPPLTRYGWAQPFVLRKAFADNWGYAVELGGYITNGTLEKMKNPSSNEARSIALVKSNPKKYKLSVTCARYFPKEVPPGTWTRAADGKLLNGKAKSYDGTEWHPGMKTVVSPLAPDALWEECGRGRAEPLAAVRQEVPISIILNGGEFGLGVWGFAGKVWKKDPRVMKAINAHGDWFDYISKRKANSEKIIADAVRRAVPDRDLYIYYTTSGGGHRHRWGGWRAWGFDYKHKHVVSDLPSDEHYANHFNSGWTGRQDILTLALNSAGYQIAMGHPLAYSWFWCKRKNEDMRTYMGFLKCIYVMGTIGGNAGAYHQPDFSGGFKPEDPPYWIAQMIVLSRVHAFFSHLEDYLRHGKLVPGEYRHYYSVGQPAYELVPTELRALEKDRDKTPFVAKSIAKRQPVNPATWEGGKDDIAMTLKPGRGIRVLARRHQTKPECLVVAWAADAKDREVTIDLPEFGVVKLLARQVGSVYLVTKTEDGPTTKLLDTNRDQPSLSFAP